MAGLRDDAFETEGAGALQHQLAVLHEVGAVPNSAAVDPDQLAKQFLAADERRFAQIVSVEIEAIEGVIGEAVEASVAEVRLQERKLGDAALVFDHHLAVDQGGAHGQVSQRLVHGVAEFMRPIEAAPGPERNLAVLDMRLKPVAVELDLMQPSIAGGRRLRQRRQHRLDKAGQGTFGAILDRGRVQRLPCRRTHARFGRGAGAVRLLDLSRLRRPARRFPFELVNRPAGIDRLWPLFEDIGFIGGAGEFIVALDEKPVLALFARLAVHPHEMPAAVELLAVQLELEMALLQAFVRIPERRPRSIVPHDDRAAAVFAFGDRALEIGIFQRMVFDRDGEALLAWVQARTAGHRPALENPVQREPEVVMQSRRVMLLHDKNIAVRNRRGAFGFGGRGEIALFPIGFERHPSARLAAWRGWLCLRRGASAGLFLGRSLAAWPRRQRRFRATPAGG